MVWFFFKNNDRTPLIWPLGPPRGKWGRVVYFSPIFHLHILLRLTESPSYHKPTSLLITHHMFLTFTTLDLHKTAKTKPRLESPPFSPAKNAHEYFLRCPESNLEVRSEWVRELNPHSSNPRFVSWWGYFGVSNQSPPHFTLSLPNKFLRPTILNPRD